MTHAAWPELPLSAWKDTYATLHLWTQIVGKIRLAQTLWLNQSWHVVFMRRHAALPPLSSPTAIAAFSSISISSCFWSRPATAKKRDRALPALCRRLLCRRHALAPGPGIDVRVNQLPNEIPTEQTLMEFLSST